VGIKLRDIPAAPVAPGDLVGRTVAIDAPNLLYAFYAAQLLRAPVNPETRAAALRAATRGLAHRIADLTRQGARTLVVFDGPPHPLKAELLAARDATRSVPPIGAQDYAAPRAAARALGVPTLEAPHDAEAQAAWMTAQGHADLVATTDWDALAMGAPTLLRNLSAHPEKKEGRAWSLVQAPAALAHLNATAEELRCAVILMGCDYFDGYPQLGPTRALSLARQARGDLATALRQLPAHEALHARAHQAHALLAAPPHRNPGTLRWTEPDHDALARALAGKPAETPKREARQTRLDA
jgi:flap endonuclease-1